MSIKFDITACDIEISLNDLATSIEKMLEDTLAIYDAEVVSIEPSQTKGKINVRFSGYVEAG
jgi:uncharacterized protein YacL (UPF0231 family)